MKLQSIYTGQRFAYEGKVHVVKGLQLTPDGLLLNFGDVTAHASDFGIVFAEAAVPRMPVDHKARKSLSASAKELAGELLEDAKLLKALVEVAGEKFEPDEMHRIFEHLDRYLVKLREQFPAVENFPSMSDLYTQLRLLYKADAEEAVARLASIVNHAGILKSQLEKAAGTKRKTARKRMKRAERAG